MKVSSRSADLLGRLGLMLIVYLVFALHLPSYYSAAGVAALLDSAVLSGLVALGVALTMIAGEMDLSVGSLAALAGILAVKLFPIGVFPSIIVVVLVCAAIGALQGWLIHRIGINSMIFTVGTLIAFRGIALLVSGEKTQLVPLESIGATDVLIGKFGIISVLSLALFAAAALIFAFTRWTLWGREIFAIGGGRSESRAAGVPIRRPIMIAFALSAALAGLAGALLSLKAGSASPLSYDSLLLEAVAACLIGGISLKGGKGSIVGVLIGLFCIRFLVTGIAALGAPFWAQSLATGLLLIIVIVAEAIFAAAAGRFRLAMRRPAPIIKVPA